MMLGRRGRGCAGWLVKTNDNSAFAAGKNPGSPAPVSNTATSARPKRLKQFDFIVNLDSGKIGVFNAILFRQWLGVPPGWNSAMNSKGGKVVPSKRCVKPPSHSGW
jgi:hypothetical protein